MAKGTATITTSDNEGWYTAGDAAVVLSKNSGRTVRPDYIAKLGSLEKIRTRKIHARLTLYYKPDVDSYRVEDRGIKCGAAKKAKAKRNC